jgi:rare lipoprotein A (peptidoglycan hydrolase)
VTVRDHMANRVRLVDLSKDAFERLAPLSTGVIQVTLSQPEPAFTLPPTSTLP